jgi:hypothetical protein
MLGLSISVVGSATAAPAPKGAPSIGQHMPQIDGPVSSLTGADGRTFAAWAYRANGEFDIAVTIQDAGSTSWTEPVFFGRHNGSDDVLPALAIDAHGTAYVAYAMSNPSRVALVMLPAGSTSWTEPVVVSGKDSATSPALMIVGDRLVIAFRTANGVTMINVPVLASSITNGIEDGPDGTDGLGIKNKDHPTASTSYLPPNPGP